MVGADRWSGGRDGLEAVAGAIQLASGPSVLTLILAGVALVTIGGALLGLMALIAQRPDKRESAHPVALPRACAGGGSPAGSTPPD